MKKSKFNKCDWIDCPNYDLVMCKAEHLNYVSCLCEKHFKIDAELWKQRGIKVEKILN